MTGDCPFILSEEYPRDESLEEIVRGDCMFCERHYNKTCPFGIYYDTIIIFGRAEDAKDF